MSKRVTIMIDDDLDRKIRLLQAKAITKEQKAVSFSKTLNGLVRKALK